MISVVSGVKTASIVAVLLAGNHALMVYKYDNTNVITLLLQIKHLI